ALLAVALGADAVGFVFAPSPRQISVRRADDISRRLPPENPTVGVFRDEAPERVVSQLDAAGLKAAQLHGHETPAVTRAVHEGVRFVIQAFPAGSAALDRAPNTAADVILVDSPSPGSGQLFDWTLVDQAPMATRLLLAGGLTPDNVASALAPVEPGGGALPRGGGGGAGRE